MLDDLEILLDDARRGDGSDYALDYPGYSQIHKTIRDPSSSILRADDDVEIEMVNQHVHLIVKLYHQAEITDRKKLSASLTDTLFVGEQNISSVALLTLIHVGQLPVLVDTVTTKIRSAAAMQKYSVTLALMSGYMEYEWARIGEAHVKKLRKWVIDILEKRGKLGQLLEDEWYFISYPTQKTTLENLRAQTTQILVEAVARRIESGYNPEINQDAEALKQEFRKYGFPAELAASLDKIDTKLAASTDKFDYKSVMDMLRAFTERFYRTILDDYEDGKKIDEKNSKSVSKFFIEKGLTGIDFGNMLENQRHFLSNNASHRLQSREEDARLSRNMVIEMSLYLLRRYETH